PSRPGGEAPFRAASARIPAGLVGLFRHYQREKSRAAGEEEAGPPRVHRRALCRIERPLLDKLTRAVRTLRQRADERHWDPDWRMFQEHHGAGDALLQKGDLAGAFREYCRAMLPLTRALSERRHKEEVF